MRVFLKRAADFILCNGKYFGRTLNPELLRYSLTAPEFAKAPPDQLNLITSSSTSLMMVSEL